LRIALIAAIRTSNRAGQNDHAQVQLVATAGRAHSTDWAVPVPALPGQKNSSPHRRGEVQERMDSETYLLLPALIIAAGLFSLFRYQCRRSVRRREGVITSALLPPLENHRRRHRRARRTELSAARDAAR
jgi:hypothetical protein